MSPVPKHRVGTPPSQVIKEILQTNLTPKSPPELANRNVKNQAPHITWLADSDPALSSDLILPIGQKRIYPVRNIANQLTTSLGSVDYGVLTLHSPVLLITTTSENETILALLSHPEDLPEATKKELHHLFTPFKAVEEAGLQKSLSLAVQQKLLIEQNIDYQVDMAVKRYKARIRAGRLVVVGSILDTNNSYGHGSGRLIIININGVSADKKLKRSRVLKNVSPALLSGVGRKVAK
jgi:carbonic anhydrase